MDDEEKKMMAARGVNKLAILIITGKPDKQGILAEYVMEHLNDNKPISDLIEDIQLTRRLIAEFTELAKYVKVIKGVLSMRDEDD